MNWPLMKNIRKIDKIKKAAAPAGNTLNYVKIFTVF